MIDREHALPLAQQAKALSISRGTLYYASRPVPAADLALMRRIDELHLEYGPMRLMIAPGRAALCLRWPMSIPAIAGRNILARIWRLFAVCCRWMDMGGSRRCGAIVMMAR